MTELVATCAVVTRGKLRHVTERSSTDCGDDRRLSRRVDEVVVWLLAEITSGTYMVGARLPSLRDKSTYGAAPRTVKAAMDRLIDMGVVESRDRSGYHVARIPAQEGSGGDAVRARLDELERSAADLRAQLAEHRERLERLERG